MPSKRATDDNERPFVEVTLRYEMPCPKGVSEEEALEAAEAEYSDVRESDEAKVEFRYVDTGGER